MKKKKADPRVVRTRQMFKDALVSLSQERDIVKLTIQDIAERATLNRATFYLHFRDLDDLIKQTADEILVDLFTIVSNEPHIKANPHLGIDQPSQHLLLMLEHFYKNAALYSIMLEKSMYFRARMFDVIKNIFTFGIEIRKLDGQAFTVPLDIIVPSFFGVVFWWLQNGTPYTPSYLADQLWLLRTKGPYTQMENKDFNP